MAFKIITDKTPKELGFHMPAEFEKQESIWLSWPHNINSWPDGKKGKEELNKMLPFYAKFVAQISKHQKVCINVNNEPMRAKALALLLEAGAHFSNIKWYFHKTNDAWCRDHGPAILVNRTIGTRAVVDWGYNAWGNKYPHDLDNQIPIKIARELKLPVFQPGIVMEGGSIDVNGKGTLITTSACLMNKNRNPELSQSIIEQYLMDYYGVENVLWLGDGIEGDDTDGHVDDITRFVDEETVVTVVQHDKDDPDYKPLMENVRLLEKMRLETGKSVQIMEIPMPKKIIYKNQRLPASYANFLISNKVVIVPTFQDDKNDGNAIDVLTKAFPGRSIIPIDSTAIIWGLGSFHCLSQQEPAV